MTTELFKVSHPGCGGSMGPPIRLRRPILLRLIDAVCARHGRAASRYGLSELSDHTLKDIGVTRTPVYRVRRKADRLS